MLDALAGAQQLDDAERAHLVDLARAAQPAVSPRRRRQAKSHGRPAVQQVLDAMTGEASFVRNDRLDILSGNQLGDALYSEMFVSPVRPVNTARFVFDPRAAGFYLDWERAATDVVAVLRSAAGRIRPPRPPLGSPCDRLTNISPTTLADILGREQVTDIATALCCLSRNGVAG